MEAGAKPRHLRGDDGGLGGSSTGQGCGGGRQEAETEAFPGVTGPRIGQRGPDHRRSVRFLFARPPIVRQFSRYEAGPLVSGRLPLPRFRGDVAG